MFPRTRTSLLVISQTISIIVLSYHCILFLLHQESSSSESEKVLEFLSLPEPDTALIKWFTHSLQGPWVSSQATCKAIRAIGVIFSRPNVPAQRRLLKFGSSVLLDLSMQQISTQMGSMQSYSAFHSTKGQLTVSRLPLSQDLYLVLKNGIFFTYSYCHSRRYPISLVRTLVHEVERALDF
jgi:hypothetical protein